MCFPVNIAKFLGTAVFKRTPLVDASNSCSVWQLRNVILSMTCLQHSNSLIVLQVHIFLSCFLNAFERLFDFDQYCVFSIWSFMIFSSYPLPMSLSSLLCMKAVREAYNKYATKTVAAKVITTLFFLV